MIHVRINLYHCGGGYWWSFIGAGGGEFIEGEVFCGDMMTRTFYERKLMEKKLVEEISGGGYLV